MDNWNCPNCGHDEYKDEWASKVNYNTRTGEVEWSLHDKQYPRCCDCKEVDRYYYDRV